MSRFCSKCGAPAEEGAKFCTKCAAPLNVQAIKPDPAPTPTPMPTPTPAPAPAPSPEVKGKKQKKSGALPKLCSFPRQQTLNLERSIVYENQ